MALHIGTSINPVAGYPLPARKSAYASTAQAAQDAPQTTVPKTSEILEAEAFWQRRQTRADWQQTFPDQRSRRALQAYEALEQSQQRDYVSQVLGVDEYV